MPSPSAARAALALVVCAAVAPLGHCSYTCLSSVPPQPATVAPADAARPLDRAAVAYSHLGPPAASFALAGWLYARPAPTTGGADAAPFAGDEGPAAPAAEALKSAVRAAAGLQGPGGVGSSGAGFAGGRGAPGSAHAAPPSSHATASGLATPQDGSAGVGPSGDAGSLFPPLAGPLDVAPPGLVASGSPGQGAEPPGPGGGSAAGDGPIVTPPFLGPEHGSDPGQADADLATPPSLGPVLIPSGPGAADAGDNGAAPLQPPAPAPEPDERALVLTALAPLALYAAGRGACAARARGRTAVASTP